MNTKQFIRYPKRQAKKQINRERLIESARELFSTHGYQTTRLEDVAAKADLHVQTLYRLFESKENLAAEAAKFVIGNWRQRFEANSRDQSTFQIWRSLIRRAIIIYAPSGWEHKRAQLRSASSLMNDNFLLIVYSGWEDLLTEYLAKDFQMDSKHDRLPRLVASFLWSGHETAMKRCAGLDTDKDVLIDDEAVLAESLGVVDDVENIFSGYIKRPGLTRS
jgi:AcrR family transcriptional regulator|tara:strand:- start:171 stop:830 length:660 start_codon:yes stop_codon:yes gene_type:complete